MSMVMLVLLCPSILALSGEIKMSLREVSVHMGIVYDKLALIRGEGQAIQAGGVNIVMNIPDTMDQIKVVENDL